MHELEAAIRRIATVFQEGTATVNIEIRGIINNERVVLRPGNARKGLPAACQPPLELGFGIDGNPNLLDQLVPDNDVWAKYDPVNRQSLGTVRIVGERETRSLEEEEKIKEFVCDHVNKAIMNMRIDDIFRNRKGDM